jgi:hypothetical protein
MLSAAVALVALAASCAQVFVDGPGDQMTFRGVTYYGQTAGALEIDAADLTVVGTATEPSVGYAADAQVLALRGVDPGIAVIMKAAPGAGGEYLLFGIAGALSDHRLDAIPGLCAYAAAEHRTTVGCD